MPGARFHVLPPVPPSSPYGLLTVVDARYDEPSPRWRQGVEWDSLCGQVNTTYDPCNAVLAGGGVPPSPPAKTSELTYEQRGATPFTVVARFNCSPAAWAGEAERLAAEALTRLESYQVERAFWTGVSAGQEVVFPHLAADVEVVDGATLLQPAAAVVAPGVLDLVDGLGRLEAALATCYGGAGVIHAPVSLSTALASERLTTATGGQLRTLNGNLVAIGGGYPGTGPDGTAPAAGTTWMYATGPAFAYRSRVWIPEQPTIVDRKTNTVSALAERTYVLGFDCCLLGVLVRLG